jgi:PAS domain S-box-containing protein
MSEILTEEIELLKRKLLREKGARQQAEKILEAKAVELHEANEKLRELNADLEVTIQERSESLNRSQIQYKLLIQNLQSAVLLEDENRKIVVTNENFCKLFQIPAPPDALVGADCTQSAEQSKHFFKDPEVFVKRIEKLLEDKKLAIREELNTVNNRILERDYIPIFSGEKYLGHLWLYNDVTEQKSVQTLIQQSEEKYRGIIENMELGLMEVNNDDEIQKVYDRFCQLTGYEEHELIGKKAADVLLPDAVFRGLIAEQNETRKEGTPGAYEVPIKKKNGEIIWVIVSGAPIINSEGEVTGSVGIHLDITERKRTQEALEEARLIAEEARKSEKRFLANMSHEIRTPINAIIGMTHLMYDTHPSEKQTEYLNAINYSTDLLLNLVSDILDISKIEAGEMQMAENAFCLKDLLNSVLHTFRIQAQAKNITLDFEYDEEIENEVIGDATFLTQILLNLLSNALKFTQKGKIGIQVSLLCRLGDYYMTEFKVFDTGLGISEKDIDRIFDSFRQANNQVKSKFGGTGLGLAIVKQLVNLHGGDISVESIVGEGTVFNFTLPLKDSGNKPKQISKIVEQLSGDWKAYKVLVVEDNLINQKYVEGLMQKWDIPVVIASDGESTLQTIDNQTFDLILMDIVLPDTDGYVLTKTIRNKEGNANQNIPIVALSATALNEEIELAYAAGMNDYLTKPFRPEQLREILEKNLKNIKPKAGTKEPSQSVENQPISINLKKMYGDDAGYALHMLKLFTETIPKEVESLKLYFEEENIEKLGRLVHQIKPSYTMVGLPEMTEKLQIIEKAIKQGAGFSQVKDAISEFIIGDSKTLELLEKEIGKLKKS